MLPGTIVLSDLKTIFFVIHDQAKPLSMLKGIHRTLKSDGVSLRQDISGTSHLGKNVEHPLDPFPTPLVHALLDGVPRARRGRFGCDVGQRKDKGIPTEGGFSPDHDALAHA